MGAMNGDDRSFGGLGGDWLIGVHGNDVLEAVTGSCFAPVDLEDRTMPISHQVRTDICFPTGFS